MRRFSKTDDRPLFIERRLLFHLHHRADWKFSCQLAIGTQRVRVDRLHRRQTWIEVEIQKREHDLAARHILALSGNAARVPERSVMRAFEPVIVGIERFDAFGRV